MVTVGEAFSLSNLHHRGERAFVQADPALRAFLLVDYVSSLLFAGNGAHRAILQAQAASLAGLQIDLVAEQPPALLGRAAFFDNVGFIFIAKVADGRKDWVGSGLPQPAE